MRVQSLLVESVDLRRLGGSAGGNDLPGDGFDGSQMASGEKELGPLTRKGTRDSAADPASGSVDHGNPVLQHHLGAWALERGYVWLITAGWVGKPWWLCSYQRRTRSARSVFHRLGRPSPSSSAKWTAPGWVFSRSHVPSGCCLDRTKSIASSRRGSGGSPAARKYSRARSTS